MRSERDSALSRSGGADDLAHCLSVGSVRRSVEENAPVESDGEELVLFDAGPRVPVPPHVRRSALPQQRIWTESKAQLIAQYLYGFLMVTKSGTYIDGFAGPQDADKPDAWA